MAKRPKSTQEDAGDTSAPNDDVTLPDTEEVLDQETDQPEDQPIEDAEIIEDDEIEQVEAPEVVSDTDTRRTGGFLPMVLGGVVAAGAGFFGAQQYYQADALAMRDLQSSVAQQTQRVDELTTKLGDAPKVDLSGLENDLKDAQSQISALTEKLTSLEAQVTDLSNRGPSSGAGGDMSGVQKQLDDLRAAVDAQKGSLTQMIDAAKSEQANAEETAKLTAARSAVTRILVALESGAPFDTALADVSSNSDVAIPEALAKAATTGAPTVTDLAQSYPAAARNALAAARSEETGGGLSSFLTRQLGARSVTPQEGDSPNAVLSRMEAAVKEGSIAEALAEMDKLPDAAKAPLAEWAAQANLRLTIASEAEALSTSLNSQ